MKLLAALIGLGVGLLVVLLIAWALSVEEAETVRVEAAPAVAVAQPVATPAPEVPVVVAAPVAPVAADLRPQLEKGRSLGDSQGEIDAWIEETKRLLAEQRPGVLGYFAALGSRSFPDERARLDAHLSRLATIVHG